MSRFRQYINRSVKVFQDGTMKGQLCSWTSVLTALLTRMAQC